MLRLTPIRKCFVVLGLCAIAVASALGYWYSTICWEHEATRQLWRLGAQTRVPFESARPSKADLFTLPLDLPNDFWVDPRSYASPCEVILNGRLTPIDEMWLAQFKSALANMTRVRRVIVNTSSISDGTVDQLKRQFPGIDFKLVRNVVELPRPNSGSFTFEQAELRKQEILSNLPSEPFGEWHNPFMGFGIHVSSDDTFTIYSASGVLNSERPTGTQTVKQIMDFEEGIIRIGNPHGVLITSDRPLSDSKTFPALLEAIFKPSIQIFYLGPTNERNPLDLENSNPPPVAAMRGDD